MLGFRYFGSSNEEVGGELVEQKQILQNFRRFRHFERDSPEKRKKTNLLTFLFLESLERSSENSFGSKYGCRCDFGTDGYDASNTFQQIVCLNESCVIDSFYASNSWKSNIEKFRQS